MSRHLAAVTAAVLLLTACAGAESEHVPSLEDAPSTSAAGLLSAEDAALAYAVYMPDPEPGGGLPGFDKYNPEFAAAYEACARVFDSGTK